MAAGTVNGPQTLFDESVSAVTATNTVALGTLREEGGNKYRYVYMQQAANPGYGVMLTSGGSGYSVTASMTTGDVIHGVIQNTTATTGTYCWVLREGLAKIQVGTAGVATTKWLTPLGSGSFGDWAAYQNVANSGATGGTLGTNWCTICGRTLGSAITAGSILAQVNFI
jgi:hypothetical protein